MRGETAESVLLAFQTFISIHSPHAGRDALCHHRVQTISYFNPLSPCGERPKEVAEKVGYYKFQSTLPMRGETSLRQLYRLPTKQFQSTLPMRGETRAGDCGLGHERISIHSPHAGRDQLEIGSATTDYISIHSPHAGRDKHRRYMRNYITNFNPLSPCGERLADDFSTDETRRFQSTLPMRGETIPTWNGQQTLIFQSTLPMRGETPCSRRSLRRTVISIHSPHAGRDPSACLLTATTLNFNPLSPCGERRANPDNFAYDVKFQSTLPMRGETRDCSSAVISAYISIHSPHAG